MNNKDTNNKLVLLTGVLFCGLIVLGILIWINSDSLEDKKLIINELHQELGKIDQEKQEESRLDYDGFQNSQIDNGGNFDYFESVRESAESSRALEEGISNENELPEEAVDDVQEEKGEFMEEYQEKINETLNEIFLGNIELKQSEEEYSRSCLMYTQWQDVYYSIKSLPEKRGAGYNPVQGICFQLMKYEKGKKYRVGYEGSEGEISLDDIVNNFGSLSDSGQITKMPGFGVELETFKLDYQKIGSKYYGIYNSYFKPSGDWVRHYITYDEKLKQIIQFNIGIAPYDYYDLETGGYKADTFEFEWIETGEWEGYYEYLKYPDEVQQQLDQFEQILTGF